MGFFDKLRGKGQSSEGGKVTDPVCHMSIDPKSAAGTSRHGAETVHFCSAGCKKRFDADPHKYLGAHSH